MTYPVLLGPDRIMPWVQQLVPQLERDREEERQRGRLIQEPTISSGTVTIDLADGPVVLITLTENISTMNITKPEPSDELMFPWWLLLLQDGTGSRTVSFSGDLTWPGASAPTVTSTADKLDIFQVLFIQDVHYANTFGQNY